MHACRKDTIVDAHFEDYARIHEQRFEPTCGPLRSVVRQTVEAFLDCGRLHNGFARIRCPSCKGEHLLTQIPDPRQHLVRYYGAYANRVRARYVKDAASSSPAQVMTSLDSADSAQVRL